MELLTPAETAAKLHIHKRTLMTWKQQRYGPVPMKVGARLFYTADDVEEFLNAEREAAKREWVKS